MSDDTAKIIAKLEMLDAKVGQLANDVKSLREELPRLRGDLTLVMARQNSGILSNKKKLAGLPMGSPVFTTD